jgi:hypothetical protein
MPISGSTTFDYPNVKALHMTKSNSPEEPVQLAFSVIDDAGREEIVTGQCPTAAALYQLVQEAGWLGRTATARPIRAMQTRAS